jgi:hypothetical protein
MAGKEDPPKYRKKTVKWTNEMIADLIDFIEIHPIVAYEAHIDLFLEVWYTQSKNLNSRNLNGDLDAKLVSCIPGFIQICTIVHNNAIQRAAPSSPPKYTIVFVVSPAKTCVYSSKILASSIHKLEFKFSETYIY